MSLFTKLGNDIASPVDASGNLRSVDNADMQRWMTEAERLLAAQSMGAVTFGTLAQANGSLAYDPWTTAWVLDDPVVGNNGWYTKTGASGAGGWVRVGDLPYCYIRATNAGAGSANAIVATTTMPIPVADGGALISLNITSSNTATPVTVAFNGGSALTVKSAAGGDISASSLVAGMVVAGYVSGSNFRLITDYSSAAHQAAAQAWAENAEDDPVDTDDGGNGTTTFSAKHHAIKAAASAVVAGGFASSLLLAENTFATVSTAEAWAPDAAPDYIRTAGYSSAGDGGGALYKKVVSEPAHEGKFSITLDDGVTQVWYEIAEPVLRLEMLGGKGDKSTINTAALNAAASIGRPIRLGLGTYLIDCPHYITTEAGVGKCTLPIVDALTIEGDHPVFSILKLADDVSTDAAPVHHNILATNDLREGIVLRNFTYDGNGQNNKISPRRFKSATVTVYNAYPGIVGWTGHKLMAGDSVHFDETTGTLPSELNEGTQYFVAEVLNENAFTICVAPGQPAIDIAAPGTGTVTATGGHYSPWNTALLMISGSSEIVGTDAYAFDVHVEGVTIKNVPGVSCIVVGQSVKNMLGGGTGGPLSARVWIDRCRFSNVGIDSFDHSCIYGWSRQFWVTNCVFEHPTVSNGIEGPVAACELHGAGNWFTGNKVKNFIMGVYTTYNYTEYTRGQWVADNDMEVLYRGVSLFGDSATAPHSNDILIKDNRIKILSDAITGTRRIQYPKRALDLQLSYGIADGLSVTGNILDTTDHVSSVGIMLGALDASASIIHALITANVIRGFPIGVSVGPNGGSGGIYNLKITDNEIVGLTPATDQLTTIGVLLSGNIGNVHVTGNQFFGEAGDPDYPVLLDGATIGHLHAEGNTVNLDNGTTGHILSTGTASITRRTGRDANPSVSIALSSTSIVDGAGIDIGPVTVPGADPLDFVVAALAENTPSGANAGIQVTARCQASNEVMVRIQNETGASVNLDNGAIRVQVIK